ncbi:MAG TPA: FAD-binding domain [Tepidisphaeraceae bacterium]|jgi:2-polyprenyl-6-methoxyphenol hydroxylase-like FAD-dependent oxidoreductase|nr:FAD-binding domain [Tepidisphaeraceae bacterium]
MRVLISGAGIAGPALAYWLLCYGHEPALVERAPTLRTGGYVVDFWGAGFDIAERMGLLPELRRKGYFVTELRVVNRAGRRISGFSADVFARMTGGRYLSIPRGELATSIFGLIDGKVETIFGDSISGIEQTEADVRVAFEHGKPRQFDLVIGADGLHSTVRELAFGPQRRFEKYMGYKVAAFEAEGYSPRDELVYVMFTEVGQQVGRFSMRDDRTMFLFIFADDQPQRMDLGDVPGQKALLRRRFGNSGWECPRILDALDTSDELYFDRVSQIRMNPNEGLWTRGRVALVGDAAFCVSLLGGQGCALAMIAAYILAGELHRSGGDHSRAFARYQELFGPFVAGKQEAAEGFAGFFAPRSRPRLFLRNQMIKTIRISWMANLVFGRGLLDKIELPEYL